MVLFSAWNARAASSNGGFKFPILEDFFALNRRIKAVHILSAQFVGLLTRISQRNFAKVTKTEIVSSAIHLDSKDPAFVQVLAD